MQSRDPEADEAPQQCSMTTGSCQSPAIPTPCSPACPIFFEDDSEDTGLHGPHQDDQRPRSGARQCQSPPAPVKKTFSCLFDVGQAHSAALQSPEQLTQCPKAAAAQRQAIRQEPQNFAAAHGCLSRQCNESLYQLSFQYGSPSEGSDEEDDPFAALDKLPMPVIAQKLRSFKTAEPSHGSQGRQGLMRSPPDKNPHHLNDTQQPRGRSTVGNSTSRHSSAPALAETAEELSSAAQDEGDGCPLVFHDDDMGPADEANTLHGGIAEALHVHQQYQHPQQGTRPAAQRTSIRHEHASLPVCLRPPQNTVDKQWQGRTVHMPPQEALQIASAGHTQIEAGWPQQRQLPLQQSSVSQQLFDAQHEPNVNQQQQTNDDDDELGCLLTFRDDNAADDNSSPAFSSRAGVRSTHVFSGALHSDTGNTSTERHSNDDHHISPVTVCLDPASHLGCPDTQPNIGTASAYDREYQHVTGKPASPHPEVATGAQPDHHANQSKSAERMMLGPLCNSREALRSRRAHQSSSTTEERRSMQQSGITASDAANNMPAVMTQTMNPLESLREASEGFLDAHLPDLALMSIREVSQEGKALLPANNKACTGMQEAESLWIEEDGCNLVFLDEADDAIIKPSADFSEAEGSAHRSRTEAGPLGDEENECSLVFLDDLSLEDAAAIQLPYVAAEDRQAEKAEGAGEDCEIL